MKKTAVLSLIVMSAIGFNVFPTSEALGEEQAALPKAFIDGVGPGWVELGKDDFVRVNCDPETYEAKPEPACFHDLTQDPYEQCNLIKTGDQNDTRDQLEAELRSWDADSPWLDTPSPPSIWQYLEHSHWASGEPRSCTSERY